jgi:hypothetical protein
MVVAVHAVGRRISLRALFVLAISFDLTPMFFPSEKWCGIVICCVDHLRVDLHVAGLCRLESYVIFGSVICAWNRLR